MNSSPKHNPKKHDKLMNIRSYQYNISEGLFIKLLKHIIVTISAISKCRLVYPTWKESRN